MPTSYNQSGKPGYIYDESGDTWYLISGKTDTSSGYEWSGAHEFLSTLNVSDHLIGNKGINNFLNPSDRNTNMSPVAGSICILRQDGSGNIINQLQYYDGSSWIAFIPSQANNSGRFLQTNGIITTWATVPDATVTGLLFLGG